MQPEIGKIYEGKVTGITKFGAFVELEPGKTGMVHISEVASTYVNEIRDHLTEGQMVKVKVLSLTDDGKIALSIKKALDNRPEKDQRKGGQHGDRNGGKRLRDGSSKPQNRSGARPDNKRSAPHQQEISESSSFEDMLSRFKASSDERMGDIKRNMNNKRRDTSRKRSG